MTPQPPSDPKPPPPSCERESVFWRWIIIAHLAGIATVLCHFFIGPVAAALAAAVTIAATFKLHWHIHQLTCKVCRSDDDDDEFRGNHPLLV